MKLYFKAWCSKLTSLELLKLPWFDIIGDGLACQSTLIDYECKNICRIDYMQQIKLKFQANEPSEFRVISNNRLIG